MAKDYDDDPDRPSDQAQVAALRDLGDYEVAEGYPDPRGWTVRSSDGARVGKVHDLIVDTGSMRTRYLDVRLAKDVAGATEDRDVLVPIGAARMADDDDTVIVNGLTADRIVMLPAYDHRRLTREQETDLRTRFTSGDAMSAGVIGAGATSGSDFYDHQHFDDRNFFGGRRGRDATVRDVERETPRELARDVDARADRTPDQPERLTVSEEQLAIGKRMVEAGEIAVRKNVETRHVEQEVPLTREEAVVEQRLVPTEEIIIRKTARRETKTVGADLRRELADVDKGGADRVRENVVERTDEERRA